jgi:pSer/pThr/pTyr-binding forkhead associated (FHA) protein
MQPPYDPSRPSQQIHEQEWMQPDQIREQQIRQELLAQQQVQHQRQREQHASQEPHTLSSPNLSPQIPDETHISYQRDAFFLEQVRPPSSRTWILENDRLSIGRDPSSDIFVDDPEVSRHHAELVRHGQDWSIIDAGSTNGTSVNGTKVREVILQPGNRIEVGDVELALRHSGADARPLSDSWPAPRRARRSSRASRKREFINIRVSRRILWVDDEAYPLQNIARAQTVELRRDRGAALWRYLKAMVCWVLLGAAATAATEFSTRLSSSQGSNALHDAGVGVLVLALVLAVISTIRLIAVLLSRTYYALVIETSGTPSTALVSDDEAQVRQIVHGIISAIDNPQAEFEVKVENHNYKHFGDNITQYGAGSTGKVSK